jgi:hypothetical protein
MAVEPIKSAQEVCARAQLGSEALGLLQQDQTPAAYFNVLVAEKHYRDAVRFAANLLEPAQAVWWGCVCAWQALKPNPNPPQSSALQAAVHWVLDPTEPRRRRAESAGKAAGAGTPAGAVALAAFYSSGSLAPANLPEVLPPPGLSAQMVAGAILLAAAHGPADQKEYRCRQFLSMAIEIAHTWVTWEDLRKSH